MLDYARALQVAINPPPLGLVTLTALAGNAYRALKERRQFIAQIRARAAYAQAATTAAAPVCARAKAVSAAKPPETRR